MCVEEWVLPINAILYSRDSLHRIKLEEPLTIKDNCVAGCESVICIRSTEEDKIGGSVTFKVNDNILTINKIEDKGKTISNILLNSLILKGYVCQELSYGEPKCINCVKGKRWITSKDIGSSYRIVGQTYTIPKKDFSDIQNISKNLTNGELTELSDCFKGNRKQSSSFLIGEFISLWIEFNELYNPSNDNGDEMEHATKYLKGDKFAKECDHKILYERNETVIGTLSKLDLLNRNGETNLSQTLHRSLSKPEPNHCKIICNAIICVYAIRNVIFHTNKSPSDFSAWKGLNNFLFDIVHHKQICRLDKFGISTLHDVP